MTEPGTRHYRGPHKPVGEGLCEHRWRNRTTVQVHCGWADGYRAALVRTPETLTQREIGERVYATTRDKGIVAGVIEAATLTPSERTPETLDVERLARAMRRVLVPTLDDGDLAIAVPAIAAAYAALAASPAPDPGAGLPPDHRRQGRMSP